VALQFHFRPPLPSSIIFLLERKKKKKRKKKKEKKKKKNPQKLSKKLEKRLRCRTAHVVLQIGWEGGEAGSEK
jgi:hypothetical protein